MNKIEDVPIGTTIPPTADGGLTILHLGCGRRKSAADCGMEFTQGDKPFAGPITWINLDGNPSVNPDVLCFLGRDAIDLPDDSIDLVLAHHVIEHIGEIGKVEEWFYFWQELYRVMKPTGRVQFECPYWNSIWAWADPTHIRAMSEYTFLYLNQQSYTIGGSIPDYRPKFDFQLADWRLRPDPINQDILAKEAASFINGVLTVRKPLQPYWEQK